MNKQIYSKIDPQTKINWLAALRSGHFTKGTGQLYTSWNNTYCCLGVLCVIKDAELTDTGNRASYKGDTNSDCYLPRTLVEEIKIDGQIQITLAQLNDRDFKDDKDFNHMADFISENL